MYSESNDVLKQFILYLIDAWLYYVYCDMWLIYCIVTTNGSTIWIKCMSLYFVSPASEFDEKNYTIWNTFSIHFVKWWYHTRLHEIFNYFTVSGKQKTRFPFHELDKFSRNGQIHQVYATAFARLPFRPIKYLILLKCSPFKKKNNPVIALTGIIFRLRRRSVVIIAQTELWSAVNYGKKKKINKRCHCLMSFFSCY